MQLILPPRPNVGPRPSVGRSSAARVRTSNASGKNPPATEEDARLIREVLALYGEDTMIADLVRVLERDVKNLPSSWSRRLYTAQVVGKGRSLPGPLRKRLTTMLRIAKSQVDRNAAQV